MLHLNSENVGDLAGNATRGCEREPRRETYIHGAEPNRTEQSYDTPG